MTMLSVRLRAYIDEIRNNCRFPLLLEDINDSDTKKKYKGLPTYIRAFVFIPDNKESCSVVADWQAAAYDPEYEAIAAHELGHLWFYSKGFNGLIYKTENDIQGTLYERDLLNTLVEDPVCDSMAWLRGFAIDKALLKEFNWLLNLSARKLVTMHSLTKASQIERCLSIIRLITSEFLSENQKEPILEMFRIYDNNSVVMALDYYDRVKEIVHSRNKLDHMARLTQALSLFIEEKTR